MEIAQKKVGMKKLKKNNWNSLKEKVILKMRKMRKEVLI